MEFLRLAVFRATEDCELGFLVLFGDMTLAKSCIVRRRGGRWHFSDRLSELSRRIATLGASLRAHRSSVPICCGGNGKGRLTDALSSAPEFGAVEVAKGQLWLLIASNIEQMQRRSALSRQKLALSPSASVFFPNHSFGGQISECLQNISIEPADRARSTALIDFLAPVRKAKAPLLPNLQAAASCDRYPVRSTSAATHWATTSMACAGNE